MRSSSVTWCCIGLLSFVTLELDAPLPDGVGGGNLAGVIAHSPAPVGARSGN
jgi:hypothetical protein